MPDRRRVILPLPPDNSDSGPATEEEIQEMEREKVSPDLVRLARRQAGRRQRRGHLWRSLGGILLRSPSSWSRGLYGTAGLVNRPFVFLGARRPAYQPNVAAFERALVRMFEGDPNWDEERPPHA